MKILLLIIPQGKIDYSSTEDKYSILYYIRPYFSKKIADVQKKNQ